MTIPIFTKFIRKFYQWNLNLFDINNNKLKDKNKNQDAQQYSVELKLIGNLVKFLEFKWVLISILEKNKCLLIDHFRPTTSLSSKQDSSTHKQYTTLKERQEYSTKTDSDYGYGSSHRFRPIDKDVSGARAVRVQDIPNGAVGRPVEFESKIQTIFSASLYWTELNIHF